MSTCHPHPAQQLLTGYSPVTQLTTKHTSYSPVTHLSTKNDETHQLLTSYSPVTQLKRKQKRRSKNDETHQLLTSYSPVTHQLLSPKAKQTQPNTQLLSSGSPVTHPKIEAKRSRHACYSPVTQPNSEAKHSPVTRQSVEFGSKLGLRPTPARSVARDLARETWRLLARRRQRKRKCNR